MSLRWFAVSVLFVALHGWAWAAGFGPPVNYPVGMEPFALIAADVNHDGVQDLVVSNEGMSGSPALVCYSEKVTAPSVMARRIRAIYYLGLSLPAILIMMETQM